MNWTTELISAVVVSSLSAIGTFTAFLLSFLKSKKAKYEKEQAAMELEKTKLEYETKIYDGSYVICPTCGEKLRLKNMEFKIDK